MKRANVLVLLLIAIVGGGLLLEFVVRLRHSESAIGCENHLRQVAIGALSYNETYGALPMAVAPVPPPGQPFSPKLAPGGPFKGAPVERRFSWLAACAQFVEANLAPGLDFHEPWDSEENLRRVLWWNPSITKGSTPEEAWEHRDDIAPRVLRVYQCPARRHEVVPGSPSLTDYVGVAGVGARAAELPKGASQVGIFGYDRQTRLSDVKDGLSRTIMVIETEVDNGPWPAGGFATTRGLDSTRPPYLGRDGQFASAHRQLGPRSLMCVSNVAFADGSVRALSEKIDPAVLEALSTIAGGEKVDPGIDY